MYIKNQKGITIMAEVITVIIFILILATISYSSRSSLQIRSLNSMYADIIVIQEKAANYYLKYGEAPIKTDEEITKVPADLKTNPNDEGGAYYKVDFDKLLNVSLNNEQREDAYYFINAKTLTVYYSKGVTIDNLNSDDEETYYTLPSNYSNVQKIDVEIYK